MKLKKVTPKMKFNKNNQKQVKGIVSRNNKNNEKRNLQHGKCKLFKNKNTNRLKS